MDQERLYLVSVGSFLPPGASQPLLRQPLGFLRILRFFAAASPPSHSCLFVSIGDFFPVPGSPVQAHRLVVSKLPNEGKSSQIAVNEGKSR